MNFQLSDLVVIARPNPGHDGYLNHTGSISRAFKSPRTGAKTYAVSLPCRKSESGTQVVTFAANELELAAESKNAGQIAAKRPDVSRGFQVAQNGAVLRCQRCGATGERLAGISRCLNWRDGQRCGGAMEAAGE
ncbi:MAG: hypothetical protein JWP57_4650 [Spirosoma sp.]|nr:hypothetical protein [Spirosoma sp.]